MSITIHQRPGVYSDYDLSSASVTTGGASIAALAALNAADAGVYTITGHDQAAAAFGSAGHLLGLIDTLLENGAGTILAYPVAQGDDDTETAEHYAAAFAALLAPKTASFLLCDSHALAVHQAMRAALLAAADARSECVGLVGLAQPAVSDLIARAAALNCERMALLGPDCCLTGQTEPAGGRYLAAAAAGVLAGQADPALPLGGAALAGLGAMTQVYSEAQIDTLVLGGVSPAEFLGGTAAVVRAVTTRTTTAGAADPAWRELSTILVIDQVIPSIRNRLSARFTRCRNSAAVRSAIRAQVVLALEEFIRLEQIAGYENLSVAASAQDGSICCVEFDFSVVQGLSRILVTAHITV